MGTESIFSPTDIERLSLPPAQAGPRSAARRSRRGAELADSLLFAAFVLALAWAPLWLGGNRPLAWGVNAILFPGLALLYELALLLGGRGHPVGVKSIFAPILCFAAVVAWIWFQTSPIAPLAWCHPIWAMASEALSRPLPGSVSVNPDLTALALLRLITAASAFWISLQLCRDAARARRLLYAVAFIVAGYAAYGLVSYAFYSSAILWFDTVAAPGYVRATFVNRDNFATYAGLGLLATTGLILRLYRGEGGRRSGAFTHRLAVFLEMTGRRGWLLMGMALLLLVALLATASRGGVLATVFALLSLTVLVAARSARRRGERLESLLGVAALVAAAFFFFGDIFAARMLDMGLTDSSRPTVYLIVLRMIFDAPLLGFGYGSFSDAFPMYRDRSLSVLNVWDKAHNSYLEVYQGLGLVFGTLLLGALALLVHCCFRGALERRRDAVFPIVAVAAAVLVASHALVDFSMQIQSVTLTFMALLGLGVAQSRSSSECLSD